MYRVYCVAYAYLCAHQCVYVCVGHTRMLYSVWCMSYPFAHFLLLTHYLSVIGDVLR